MVYSIETDSVNYELLVRNIKENKLEDRRIPTRVIVSDNVQTFRKGRIVGQNTGGFGFIPSSKEDDFEVLVIDKWHQSELEEREVGVVEIDIEGAELLALHSCINLIKKYSPVLYF
ncbi:MAG: FkbM family methyltransferase [Roseivirga sp.]